MISNLKHILIVGGTGMLRDATAHFIEQGNIVSVLARNEERLKNLKEKYPIKKGRIWLISQDYRDTDKALQKVKEAADMYHHIDLAVLWIHDTGRQFSERVKRFLFLHNQAVKVYQLWGSSSINPLELSKPGWRIKYPDKYREVFLGYHNNGTASRWLTSHEISKGTIRAVEQDQPKYIVGAIEPWRNRP